MTSLVLSSDAYLVGLSLTVALVVYPSFRLVGDAEWRRFHQAHVRRITYAVAPGWLAQAVGVLWWLSRTPHDPAPWIHGALALGAVLVTALRAVPQHESLSRARNDSTLDRLLRDHWARTALWTATLAVALVAL